MTGGADNSALGRAHIDSLDGDGQGVARVDGKTTFIEGALPGEEVRFEYRRRKRNFDKGRVREILIASPDRVATPRCAYFGVCGGCSLQHLDPTAQLRAKQQTLLDNLERIGQATPTEVLDPLRGPVWGYRRKARLGVRNVPKKGGALVGFRERGKSYIADMLHCEVLDPAIAVLLPTLRTLIDELSIPSRVPQIEVAVGDTATALVFRHLLEFSDADRARLCRFGEAHGLRIYLQPGGVESVHLLWPTDADPWLSYRLADHAVEIRFLPTDFVQVNAEINRMMVQRSIDLLELTADDRVLDLFCGVGNFTLPLARYAQAVTGVEADSVLVERARGNAELNAITNVRFTAANLYAEPLAGDWLNAKYDKILLDPPRTGALEIVKTIGGCDAQRLVYVSCNPATLARDTALLVHTHGYRLRSAGVMDMFPHTTHVESIAVFDRDR